jgi:hypothetical protein
MLSLHKFELPWDACESLRTQFALVACLRPVVAREVSLFFSIAILVMNVY